MYGMRTGNGWDLAPLFLYLALCAAGGWGLVRGGTRLSSGDRPLVGGTLGLVLATWGANLLGRWLDAPYAFWIAAVAVAVAGALAWRQPGALKGERRDARSLVLIGVVLVLALLFFRMGRGLAIFDDRKNLSLISLMAAGEIPPRFYMNPDFEFAYHYAFQLFGAIVMRLGGLFPWSAFDVAKGIVGALAVGLGVVWGRRATGKWTAGIWMGVILLFASGARWLLLMLPAQVVSQAGSDLELLGSGAQTATSLARALASSWVIDGGPPVALPFAFVNGIVQPLVLYLQTGPVSMGLIALLLLLILFPARSQRWTWAIFVAVFAFWALAAEAGFVLFGLATVFAAVIVLVRRGGPMQRRTALGLLGAVSLAALLAALQGGTLTEAARRLLALGDTGAATSDLAGFSLRATPAIVSSHLGEMRLGRPGELMIALFELGPALLFAPLAAWVLLRAARRHRALLLAFAISTFLGLLAPILVRYEVDRDVTRLTYYALVGWMLLAVIPLSLAWSRGSGLVRGAIVLVSASLIFAGLALTGPLLTAMPRALIADGFLPADAAMTRLVWDRLEEDSLVADSSSWRAVAVTGRLTRSARNSSTLLETWRALRDDPSVPHLVSAGFDYAYVDRTSWNEMSDEVRLSYQDACVQEIASVHDNGVNGDRWLFDLRACPPG